MARRTGRRPGNPDTREAILDAAREAFAEQGYDGASIRGIATSAGVDPALVHHYFGTKDQLFLAAMNSPIDPARSSRRSSRATGPRSASGSVRTFLRIWDSPGRRGGRGAAALGGGQRVDRPAVPRVHRHPDPAPGACRS